MFKDKKGNPSHQTADFVARSKNDDSWYFTDNKWYALNPEAPSKPVISISPNGETLNGEDSIVIKITSISSALLLSLSHLKINLLL